MVRCLRRADVYRSEQETKAEAFDAPPPDPMALFTVLYGIYPCNFAAFLKDAEGYLKGKEWKGARGDGVLDLDSAMIRDRSKVGAFALASALGSDESLAASHSDAYSPSITPYRRSCD